MIYNIHGQTPAHDLANEIVAAAKKRLPEFLAMKGLEDRNGCRILIAQVHRVHSQFSHVELLAAETVGILTEAQEYKYTHYATEKALRLFAHLPGHSTSRASSCAAKGQYAGAIFTAGTAMCIVSVSGFPELADEALATISAKDAGAINTVRALALIGSHEGNPFYPRSFDK